MAAVAVADASGEAATTTEYLDMFDLDGADLARNARLVWQDDVELAAYGQVATPTTPAELNRVHLWGTVHPVCRRQGIGRELLEWQETRGRSLHAERHPGLPGVLEVQSLGVPGHVALLKTTGYEPLRYWSEMRRELRSAPDRAADLPTGLVRRPYDREIDEALRVAHNEAFADHWGFSLRDRDFWQTWMTGRSLRTDLSSIVLDGEDIAAYVLVQYWPDDAAIRGFKDVWVSHLGTLPAWRGRGVAGALLTGVLLGAAAQGFDYVTLDVDTANPTGALGLYERAGFEVARETISYAKAV